MKHAATYHGNSGAMLEQLVFDHAKQIYRSKAPLKNSVPLIPNGGKVSWCNGPFCWKSPVQTSLPSEFCLETSIHGLKFVALPKRHLAERIFWIIAFCAGFIAAVLLINEVWVRYRDNPVIVTFEPKEQDIDSLPFPSVTICNVNKFTKSKVEEILKAAEFGTENDPDGDQAKKHLQFVRNVCSAQQSFSKEFDYAKNRGIFDFDLTNTTITEDDQATMLRFLLDYTVPCHEMIHLCMFAEQKTPCKNLFTPFITDYGKCCTFNMLPYPLLMRDPRVNHSTMGEKEPNDPWSQEEMTEWNKWNYKEGMTLPKGLSRPYRQNRAGMPYGLSILLDANVAEYFCPASDSEGFRFAIHTPLEMPHVAEFANVLEIGKEIYVEVNPDVINADDDVKGYVHESRKCYFPGERHLTFFRPYTGTNCIDECTATVITANCSCSYFYMPRHENVKVCNTEHQSPDDVCINKAKVGLLGTLKDVCGHCDGLCEMVQYNFQTTVAKIQDPGTIWGDPSGNNTVPTWSNNKMSIVHIFYGSDTTVPKIRKRLYGPTDLIASTGGLLGLCLGVSILSMVEAVYYFTMRLCCKIYGGKWDNNTGSSGTKSPISRFFRKFKKNANLGKGADTVPGNSISMNPNNIPVYSQASFYPFNYTIPQISINDGYPIQFARPHQQ